MLCLISAMHVGRLYTLLLSFTLSSAPKDRACPQIMETSDCAMFFSFNLSLIIINSIRERKEKRVLMVFVFKALPIGMQPTWF